MYVTIAVHHPRPEHVSDFTAFMKRIELGMNGTDGLVSLESYQDPATGTLVAIGRWQSPEHARAGVSRLVAIGGRKPEWTDKPDDVYRLIALSSPGDSAAAPHMGS